MALCGNNITKITKWPVILRNLSTAVKTAPIQEELPQTFRSRENNPANHTSQHVNKFYTIPPEEVKSVYAHGLTKVYQKQIQTFCEMSILIRKPALELLACLAQTDLTKPVNRYVIYGDTGCGKTTTLLHILHYGYKTRKIIINLHWAQQWFRFPKEVTNSNTKEGFMDLPIDAAAWLLNFKNQNLSVLTEKDLKLSKTYEWSPRETSPVGSSLLELIDFGISRVKYACDILIALINELKQASIAGRCQILVSIDGFNAFFSNHTQIKNDNKQFVPASKVSLTAAFLEITKSDWCNGQVIVSVDKVATKDLRDSHLPRYLLREEGFNHIDPFLPISIDNYSQDEYDTVIEYYKNRKWLRDISLEGQRELQLLTGANPGKLMDYCKNL